MNSLFLGLDLIGWSLSLRTRSSMFCREHSSNAAASAELMTQLETNNTRSSMRRGIVSPVVYRVRSSTMRSFPQKCFSDDCVVRSDGYSSHIPALKGYHREHGVYEPGSGMLHWLHIVLSNAKAFILGTYHGCSSPNFPLCSRSIETVNFSTGPSTKKIY